MVVKLAYQTKADLVNEHQNGVSVNELMKKYSIGKSTVYNIVKNFKSDKMVLPKPKIVYETTKEGSENEEDSGSEDSSSLSYSSSSSSASSSDSSDSSSNDSIHSTDLMTFLKDDDSICSESNKDVKPASQKIDMSLLNQFRTMNLPKRNNTPEPEQKAPEPEQKEPMKKTKIEDVVQPNYIDKDKTKKKIIGYVLNFNDNERLKSIIGGTKPQQDKFMKSLDKLNLEELEALLQNIQYTITNQSTNSICHSAVAIGCNALEIGGCAMGLKLQGYTGVVMGNAEIHNILRELSILYGIADYLTPEIRLFLILVGSAASVHNLNAYHESSQKLNEEINPEVEEKYKNI